MVVEVCYFFVAVKEAEFWLNEAENVLKNGTGITESEGGIKLNQFIGGN